MSLRDPRKKMARQLLQQGHASMKDLLTASFGEWPPKGLDLNPGITHEQQIVFQPILEGHKKERKNKNLFSRFWSAFKDKMGTAGIAQLAQKRIVYINKLMLIPLRKIGGASLNSTLGHEAVHILQGDHYYRAQETFGTQAAQAIWTEQKDCTSNICMQELMKSERSHHKNRLQRIFNTVSFWLHGGNADYYNTGDEVQARLHELMMDGYSRWGKIPQTHGELYAALTNAGLRPPPDIAYYLSHLPANSNVRRFLPSQKGHRGEAGELRAVCRALSPPGRNRFWHETLPQLYADLIEMYGDKQGRERFGLGLNPKAAFRQRPAANDL